MASAAERGVTGAAAGPLSYHLAADGSLRERLSAEELTRALESGDAPLWVDIDSRSEDQWLLLGEVFHFHPLAIEDTRSPGCRVKIEEYDGYLFIVVRGVRFATLTPEPYDLESLNLYLFLGRNFLVTVHAEPMRSVTTVLERVAAGPELLSRGVELLAYQLIDTLVDLYFPLLDEIDSFVDALEDDIFHGAASDVMERIFDLKRMLFELRRQLAPMRDVMTTLANRPSPFLQLETQVYFRDVYDHVVRQVESVETYRDLVSGAIDMHLSSVSNRMNQVMKSLSVVATLVLPATLVASIYGMNFGWMPFLESPIGFWVAMVAMAGVSGTFLVYLWWKGWL